MPSAQLVTPQQAPSALRPATAAPITVFPGRSRLHAVARVDSQSLCRGCAMRKVCVPSDMEGADLARFEEHAHARRRIKAGQHLFRSGDACESIYAVRSGFVRTSTLTGDGREQVTGFHMMGEVIGIDMLGGGVHATDAVALVDTEVCEMSLAVLDSLSRDMPALRRKLYQMINEQFQLEREAMLLLGSLRAEDRVASFLLNLGRRYQARGFSALRFLLCMSRADIGSHLGLRLETVSRVLSKLQAEGLLRVDSKSVEILDREGLQQVIGRSLN